jgi:hypothetical protein
MPRLKKARDNAAARNAKSGANSGDRLNASLVAPPNTQTTAREDQAGQNGGAWHVRVKR